MISAARVMLFVYMDNVKWSWYPPSKEEREGILRIPYCSDLTTVLFIESETDMRKD